MRPTPRSRYSLFTPVMCECRYGTCPRSPTNASVYPTRRSPSNAPSTCPPVCDATTNIVAGSTSSSASFQISRWSSTQRWNSSRPSHFRTMIPSLIILFAFRPVLSTAASFRQLGCVPEHFHFLARQILELPPAFPRQRLHCLESSGKFCVGLLQRDFRVDLQVSREIHRSE